MQIPEPLTAYAKDTLILVLDRKHADFYLAKDRMVDSIHKMTEEMANFENLGGERAAKTGMSAHGSIHGMSDEKIKMKELNAFFDLVADELTKREKLKEFTEIVLVVQKNYENSFRDKLNSETTSKIVKVASANLTKHALPEIIEYIQ